MLRKLITNVIGSDMYRLLAASRLINVERTQPCWILFCRAYGINHKKTVTKQHELFQRILQQKKSRLKERRQIILQDIRATKTMMREKRERIRESGQIIMQDIKETRDKVKERMEEVIEKENVFTIPNLLCVSRIIASPVLGYLIIHSNFNLALGIFAFAGFSDLIDGWIARTFKSQASKIGSFLDPMADKILIASLFLSLTYMDFIPVVLTGGIILRDVLLVAAAFYVRYKSLPPPSMLLPVALLMMGANVPRLCTIKNQRTLSRYFDVTYATAQLSPTAISKWNTGMQLVLVASTLAAPVFNYVDHPVLHAMWYVTAGTTLASAASYLIAKNTYKFLRPKKKL